MSVERTREHSTETDATSQTLPAKLSERQENRKDLRKIRELTHEKGVMELPVTVVTKSDNSESWAIEVEHPIEGTLRFYRDTPTDGWYVEDGNIVEMLQWYNNTDEDPYDLCFMSIYMEKVGNEAEQIHGWEPIAPPSYSPPPDPMKVQLKRKYDWFRHDLLSWMFPRGSVTAGWIIVLMAVIATHYIPSLPLIPSPFAWLVPTVGLFMVASFIGAAVAIGPSLPDDE